jgi:predicted site-specific integrase-resolvase
MVKTRRKRERKKRSLEKIRQQSAKEVKASEHIYPLSEILEITTAFPLLLCGRVSTQKQYDDGSLERQLVRLRKAVEDMGFKNIIDEPLVEVSLGKVNRGGLECIIAVAREYGAIPVFETTDRIIRAKDFCPKTNTTAALTVKDFEELMRVTKGDPLATVLHPDADYREIKRYQSKYEEKKKDRVLYDKSKPGWTVRRRKKYLPIVLKLRAEGMSYGEIVKATDLPLPLVRSWCR